MRFDDRLATILSQPVSSPHDRAVRWRQLVDLVARADADANRVMLEQAVKLIRSDRSAVRESVRAAAARAIAGSPVPFALLSVFAADTLGVAGPLIASASLDDQSITDLRAVASDEVQRLLDGMAPPTPTRPAAPVHMFPPALPRPPEPVPSSATEAEQRQPDPEPEPEQRSADPEPEIRPQPDQTLDSDRNRADVATQVSRLRRFRDRLIVPPLPPVQAGRPALEPSMFRWECGAGGDIEWVEGAPRGPTIGLSIASADLDFGVDQRVEQAFLLRAPFRDCRLDLGDDGSMAGEWQISGAPAFSPAEGRFLGYRGIARRPEPQAGSPPVDDADRSSGHDDLREMIHEIKTPLNAIIGFAEIIDGQYFGPAHSRYRARAADIVTNARSLLAAAEDLDFVARMQSTRMTASAGTDLSRFIPAFADSLVASAASQGVKVTIDAPYVVGMSSLDPELLERLLRRLTDAVLPAAVEQTLLTLQVRRFEDSMTVAITRPEATKLASRDELLDPDFSVSKEDQARLGIGFSLRLINGLIGMAGGRLEIEDDWFKLTLPVH